MRDRRVKLQKHTPSAIRFRPLSVRRLWAEADISLPMRSAESVENNPKRTLDISITSATWGNALLPAAERQLSEMLNQQLSENPDFPCGVLPGRADHKNAGGRNGKVSHHCDESTGI